MRNLLPTWRSCAALFSFVLAAPFAAAQISGTVVDLNGAPEADANGLAVLTMAVIPIRLSGHQVWLQAVERKGPSTFNLSAPITATIQ